jgi:2-polyprenyl-6-methoxyphenol hydroxylase-like FAD-dependent oxidoreductase
MTKGSHGSGEPQGAGWLAVAVRKSFDVVVVGGGIAGSVLAGVLARSGVQVLVAEKEPRFRDRVRGESTYPWGVAEAARLGVGAVFEQAGAVELTGMRFYEAREPVQTDRWAAASLDGLNEAGFPHPRLQEAAFCWAESMGAAVWRPVKVTGFSGGGVAAVTVTHDGRVEQVRARLVVGADGKMAQTRRWTGGHSAADPEHHRFGGVAVSGVRTDDRDTDNLAGIPGLGVNWFAQGAETTRLYLNMAYGQLRASGADRSFDALIAVAAQHMPEGALDGVRQEGPVGFFSNADTWATQIAGHGVVLIGDAAGSLDPTQGLGTSQLFRDVRELSDLLLCDDDWPAAIREYAQRRRRYFAVLRQYDLWRNIIDMDASEAADRLREGNKAAAEADPTLGGFALIEARGPDGLAAGARARAAYFGTTPVPAPNADQS